MNDWLDLVSFYLYYVPIAASVVAALIRRRALYYWIALYVATSLLYLVIAFIPPDPGDVALLPLG